MKKEKLIGLLVVGIFIMSAFQVLAVTSQPTETTADFEKFIETSAESEPAFTTRKSGVVPLTTFDVRIHGDRYIDIADDSYDPEILLELTEQALSHQINEKPAIDRNLTIGAEELFIVYEANDRGLVFDVPFTLMGIGDHCYVWVHTPEIANATNNAPHVDLGTGIINQTHVDDIVDTYDDVVFPNAYENFGMPNDVDNDAKIHIMVLDIAPDQTPDTGFTAGFHTWLNDDPPEVNPYWNTFSNQAEMIFLDTYPTIYEAHYDGDGDGEANTYYNMWDDADSNLNGWTATLMNQTDGAGLIMPVISEGYDYSDETFENTYWEVSVTSTGLAYWVVEDTTDYGSNTNDEEIAVSGYYGFTGSDVVLYFRVESATHADDVFYIEEIYTNLVNITGDGDLPTIGGSYELATGDHVYTIQVITGGFLAPVVTDNTDYGANTLAHELVLGGEAIDEAGVYTINVTTGGEYAAVVTDPVFDGTPTGTESPAIVGNYIIDEDLEFYVNVTSGGNLRFVLPDTASGGALSTYWNGSHLVPIVSASQPEVGGVFISDTDVDFVAEVVTGGLLGIDTGVSLKFSTNAGSTWSAAKVIEPNYPIRVLNSAGEWKGFTLDFSQNFYNLTAGDQFTIAAIADNNPEVAFSTDGTNFGDSVVIPTNGLVPLNGTGTGLILDFSVVTEELTVGDIWLVETTAYNAPLLEFSKDGGAIFANITLTDAGFELPYNGSMGTGITVALDNFMGAVEAEDEYIIEIEATETVSIDFAVDGGALTGTPVDWAIGDAPLNISDSGFNVDFTGIDALITDDVYELTVINGTENSATITFSNDDATYANATVVDLDNLEIAISDQTDAVYGDLMVDFSEFTKLVVGDNYQITLTGEVNPEIQVNGTDYNVNTSNPMVPLGDSGIYLDFAELNITAGALWNVTINDVTLNDLPEVQEWDLELAPGALVYANWALIDNGNDWAEEVFIRGGMPDWAIFVALGLSDPVLQNHIKSYLKYPAGMRFTVADDNPWTFGPGAEEGQSFLFLLYLYEHYGGTEFMHALSTGSTHGWDAIASALGAVGYRDMDVEQILLDYTIASYVDDELIPNSAEYGGVGHQYAYDTIDLLNFPFMEAYSFVIGDPDSYVELAEEQLTGVSIAWYLAYYTYKYGDPIYPVAGFETEIADGVTPYAGSSDNELAIWGSTSGASLKSYEIGYYEIFNASVSANLDLFFDGLDEQLFMDVDGTGPGDMFWSGDQKGANPDGTATATEPDNKYLAHTVPAGTVYLDWWAWYQLEDQWDFVQLEVSMDSADGESGTWYSLPWIAYAGFGTNGDYATWESGTDWTGTLGYPTVEFPGLPGWAAGDGNNFVTGSAGGGDAHAEAWNHYWAYVPDGATYVRYRYMTDWGTQMKGMWIDAVEFQDGAEDPIEAYSFTGGADHDWFSIGNTLADGSVLAGCGWIHPPASATPNNFLVAAIVTNFDNGFNVTGAHSVYSMETADETEIAIMQRLAEDRVGTTEGFTLIVIPTTDSDAANVFTGGLYNADSVDTGETLEFTLKPAEGLVEGANMFQWPITEVKPETVHSVLITEVSSGETTIFYAPNTNTFVWRAGTWADGDYTVQLRATYLDFNNLGVFTPYYAGQSSVAYSAVLEYTLENAGPTIVTTTSLLEITETYVYEKDVEPIASYKYSIDITDASDIYSAWIYFSDDDGATYTLALLKQGAGDTWSVEFDAASKRDKDVDDAWDMIIDIHAEDTFGLKTIVTGITEPGDVYKQPSAPGFELIFALFALAGLSVVLSRRRE